MGRQQRAQQRGGDTACEEAEPGRQAGMKREERRRIGAKSEKARVTKARLASIAKQQIPARSQDGVNECHSQRMDDEIVRY